MTGDASPPAPQALNAAWLALNSLTVYRRLLDDDPVIGRLRGLIDCCRQGRGDLDLFLEYYCNFFAALADTAAGFLGDHIIEAILYQDNPFTRRLEMKTGVHGALKAAAAHDLNCLQQLAGLAPAIFKGRATECCCRTETDLAAVDSLPEWQHRPCEWRERRRGRHEEMYDSFRTSSRWCELLERLIEFHHRHGAGVFARYRAFYWNHAGGACCLRGIADPDPVALADLIGYEAERADVIENTLQFLNGFPANNVLLYGDRGTGKSSTVKALLNEYHEQGLRLVEAPKNQLLDFPEIIRQLKGRGERFIVFVDDLSFEESESSFTALKAVLEGGLEHRPQNVLIYATSNRRHLVREYFSDRQGLHRGGSQQARGQEPSTAPNRASSVTGAAGEVHAGDTLQEKLSLADRFGITVVFPAPDQEQYLEIAEGIAFKRGIRIDREQLRQAALNWERWHNGRSPRTARQFVDWLEGKLCGEA